MMTVLGIVGLIVLLALTALGIYAALFAVLVFRRGFR